MNELAPIESLTVVAPKGPTKKQRKAMAEAQAFAKFGVHALRVKTSVLAALGKEAEDAGIKHLGSGKVIVASGHAEEAIAKLGQMVEKLNGEEKPNFALIVDLMRLQKDFNHQLIATAQVHLNMARAVTQVDQGSQITVPFPAGAPLMIAVGNKPTPQTS